VGSEWEASGKRAVGEWLALDGWGASEWKVFDGWVGRVLASAAAMPSLKLLGLPAVRGRVPLLVALGIDSFGSGVAGPLMLLFYVRVAGIPLGTAGVTLTVAGLFGLAAPVIVARVIDRLGSRNTVIGSQIAQAAAYAGLLFARSLWSVFLCALLAALGNRAFWSSIFSLISDVSELRERDRWFGLAGMIQSAGVAVGALAAGGLLALGGTEPFLAGVAANAVSFAVAGWLLTRLRVRHGSQRQVSGGTAVRVRDDRPFMILIGINTALALCSMLIGLGLPVFVAEALPAPEWIAGVLLALVSVVLATGQTLVVRFSEHRRRTRVMVVGAVLWCAWGLSWAGLLHVPAWVVVPGLVLGALLFAAADLLHAATSNALAAAASPEAGRGRYLSYWQYSWTLASIVAPAFFAQLFSVRPEYPWLVTALLAAVAGGALLAIERKLPAAAVRRTT
jgi:MFS family permease